MEFENTSQVALSFDFDPDRLTESGLRAQVAAEGAAVSFRVAPLLAVLASHSTRFIVVGRSVVMGAAGSMRISSSIEAVWQEHPVNTRQFDLLTVTAGQMTESSHVRQALLAFISSSLVGDNESTSVEDTVAGLAKSLSEAARNSVTDLKEIRYLLEHELAETSSGKSSTVNHTTVVSALLQLNIVCGRSKDMVMEIEREGLWLYLTDSTAYHAYRQSQDPSLLTGQQPATRTTRTWMPQHDAAMRQCAAMIAQLEAENQSISTLIAAASSISTSKDADAQSRFNVIAAIASIGLGLPALVLSLYGATVLLPMSGGRIVLFLPVVVALLIAATIAVWQGLAMKRGGVWIFAAVGLVAFVGLLLFWATLVASQVTA